MHISTRGLILAACIVVCGFTSASNAQTPAAQPQPAKEVRVARPNLIGGELGGKGILYSLLYERFFAGRFGVGVGMMGIGTSDGFVGLFPVYAIWTPLAGVHSPYFSLGGDFAVGSDWSDIESAWVTTAAVGYIYQSESGFFVRPTLTALFREDAFLMLPGVALGGSF